MATAFKATLLLEQHYEMDIASIADAAARDYHGLGKFDGVPSPAKPESGIIRIDETQVVIEAIADRVPNLALQPEAPLHRPAIKAPDVSNHKAHIDICCGGQNETLLSMQTYAAAVHLIAASISRIVPTLGVLWHGSGTLTAPDAFRDTIKPMLDDTMPLDIWVGFAPIVPDGYSPEAATGMLTSGLRPFLGRELELAPRRGDADSARECLSSVTRRILDHGMTLKSGQQLSEIEAVLAAKVRRRDYWLRRDRSTFVLVTDDAIVEQDTLLPPGHRSAA